MQTTAERRNINFSGDETSLPLREQCTARTRTRTKGAIGIRGLNPTEPQVTPPPLLHVGGVFLFDITFKILSVEKRQNLRLVVSEFLGD